MNIKNLVKDTDGFGWLLATTYQFFFLAMSLSLAFACLLFLAAKSWPYEQYRVFNFALLAILTINFFVVIVMMFAYAQLQKKYKSMEAYIYNSIEKEIQS